MWQTPENAGSAVTKDSIMLKNISIKARLIYVLAFLALQLVIGAVMGLTSLSKVNLALDDIYDNRLVALGHLDVVLRQSTREQLFLFAAVNSTGDLKSQYLKDLRESQKTSNAVWEKYMTTAMTSEESVLAKQFAEIRHTYESESLEPTLKRLAEGDTEGARTLLHSNVMPAYVALREPANKLINLQLDEAAKAQGVATSRYSLVRNIVMAGLLIGIITAVGMGIWLIRSIVAPLNLAADMAHKVAQGDLTVQVAVSRNDETGKVLRALSDMTASLTGIVKNVRAGTDTIATAASEIAAGNQDLSSRTEQQAASLEETASSMEELTSTVKQNADNAEQGNRLASAATDTAKRGGELMGTVVQTMEQINASSHKISEITGVIDSLAFQTNILALNAAVEAARAGEQGRGFAVVATEVRNLAQRSAEAAREIKGLITASTEQVDEGTRQVQRAGSTMNDILSGIGRVNDIMAEISAASFEQSSGIEQVNQAVSQMDQVTQQNAALVEQAAAAATSMQEEALRLTQAVAVFKTN